MTMIGFALDITSQAIMTFCVGFVSGAGGFAGIKRWIERPKIRMRVNSFNLIQTDDPEQRERIEKVLREQKLATAVTEIEWKNVGRRSAKNLAVEVMVPTGYMASRVLPSDPQTITAPWKMEEYSTKEGHRVQLRQEMLVPDVHCKLIIEYDGVVVDHDDDLDSDDDETDGLTVRFLEGDREVGETDLDADPEDREALKFMLGFAIVVVVLTVSVLGTLGYLTKPR